MEGGGSEEGKFRVGLVWENAGTLNSPQPLPEITLGRGYLAANDRESCSRPADRTEDVAINTASPLFLPK